MRNRIAAIAFSMTSALLFAVDNAPASHTGLEIPFEWDNQLMTVEVSVGKLSGLKFAIDTGASHTVVDKKILRKLGLKPESKVSEVRAFGKVRKGRIFLVPDLRFGGVLSSLYCLEEDLSSLGVDGVIGLDLLRCQTFVADCKTGEYLKVETLTIDFESRKIRFGRTEQLQHQAPIEDDPLKIIVAAKIQGRDLRLLVDTGAFTSILFKGSRPCWVDDLPFAGGRKVSMLLGGDRLRAVNLPSLELGTNRWMDLMALILNTENSQYHGVLAVSTLGMKVLHIDFDRNLMLWE